MGLSGISPGSLLLILLILIFFMGGKKIRTLGEDLGAACKSFKKAFEESDTENNNNNENKLTSDK